MTQAEAFRFARKKGLKITRQGLVTAGVAYNFAFVGEDDNIHFYRAGLTKYVAYRLDNHPDFFRILTTDTNAGTQTLVALVRAGVPYRRYGAGYIIDRTYEKQAREILEKCRRDVSKNGKIDDQ